MNKMIVTALAGAFAVNIDYAQSVAFNHGVMTYIKGGKEGGVWHVIRNGEQRAQTRPAARQPGDYGSCNDGNSGH